MNKLFLKFGKKRTIIVAAIAVVVLFLIYFFGFRKSASKYQFVPVTTGTITEVVSVTGNTTPVQSLDLAFQTGGTVAAVYKNAGDTVSAGETLESLDTSGLKAQLAQAQASVDAANANLQSLQVGPQPADIEESETALAGGEQSLNNMYANVESTLADGYAKSNDAVRTQLSAFFSNPEGNNPQLTFTINNSQLLNTINSERLQASTGLNAWQVELTAMNTSSTSSSTLSMGLRDAVSRLGIIKTFLINVSQALLSQPNLSNNTLNTYNSELTVGLNEVNTATNEVNTALQNIASQQITVQQLQAQLALKLAGSTPQAIAAQQAVVEQAQANEQSVQVNIQNASIVSPINGVITVQNAKVGEIASPGVVETSIISSNDLEIDAYVPETDIGKIAINDSSTITFDAFPGQTFSGKVFFIDPAQTIIGGVVDYKVKVALNTSSSSIKSGLTANLDIQAIQHNNVLILPQYAILQNDQGTFVETLNGSTVTQVPVTLGIQDDQGNVEVDSGVTAGEQVINIGLKQ